MATLPNDNDKEDKEFLRVQYQKLREEIVARNNAILQLENFTLAAFGTILTLGYSKIIPGIKSGNLMLFYNIIAFISFLIYISNKTVIYTIGDFIVKTESLFSANSELLWEKSIRKGKLNKYRIFNSFAVAGFFAGTQVLALIATYLYGQSLEKKRIRKSNNFVYTVFWCKSMDVICSNGKRRCYVYLDGSRGMVERLDKEIGK